MTFLFVPDVSSLSVDALDKQWAAAKRKYCAQTQDDAGGVPTPNLSVVDTPADVGVTGAAAVAAQSGAVAAKDVVWYTGDAVARHNLSIWELVVENLHRHHVPVAPSLSFKFTPAQPMLSQ